MRWLLTMTFLILAASIAWAVDYRWTSSWAQGTAEAIIRNGNDSNVVIYCPSGQEDTTPGMFIHVTGQQPVAKEIVTVQIIVDGKNYPFSLQEIQYQPTTSMDKREFHELISALASSKQKSFVIEFPKYNKAEQFSLLDARKALGRGKDFILKGCETYP